MSDNFENSPAAGNYALIDANEFYCSCEKIFRLDLSGKPIIVLSNNDSCVVSRNHEARLLNISRGVPFFKVRDVVRENNVQVFSSNYELYGNVSSRIAAILGQFSPSVERYSIDESFVFFGPGTPDLTGLGRTIRETIRRWTSIPVCVGFGRTKTLAKAANKIAKTQARFAGVLSLSGHPEEDDLLAEFPVEDVWGIGRRRMAVLKAQGITNGRELRDVDVAWARANLSVVGQRVVYELRGLSCIPIEEAPPPRRMLCSSRSFGRVVMNLGEMKRVAAHHATKIGEKLRKQERQTMALLVFFKTTCFNSVEPQHTGFGTVAFGRATAHTPELVEAACAIVEREFRIGFKYRKFGLMALDLVPIQPEQGNFFVPPVSPKDRKAMETLDLINRRFGKGTMRTAAEIEGEVKDPALPEHPGWQMRQANLTPRFTTRWDELPEAKA